MGFNSAGRATIGSAAKLGRTKWAYAKYDFDDHGGAVSTISLTGDTIPAGSIILDCVLLVDTVVTSGGSPTIALAVDDATLDAAVALTGLYDTAGQYKVDHTRADNPLVNTDAAVVTATVATAALTAGVFRVIVEYVEVES